MASNGLFPNTKNQIFYPPAAPLFDGNAGVLKYSVPPQHFMTPQSNNNVYSRRYAGDKPTGSQTGMDNNIMSTITPQSNNQPTADLNSNAFMHKNYTNIAHAGNALALHTTGITPAAPGRLEF